MGNAKEKGAEMTNLTRKIYTFVWDKDSSRTAEIIFVAVKGGGFKFTKCDYKTLCGTYDLDDWDFLGDLAQEIKRLEKEEGIVIWAGSLKIKE